MNVELTAEQKDFARQAIKAGRAQREEDVVVEALSMWEERERRRVELVAMIDEARVSYAAGRYRMITDETDLVREIGENGRARLLAKLDAAEASLVEDGGIEITQQSMRDLADDVKARGRAELAARGK